MTNTVILGGRCTVQRMFRRFSRQDGFTLLEVLVVIAILGVIAAIITPRFMDTMAQARVDTAVATGKQLQTAMERYYFAHNAYPTTTAVSNSLTNLETELTGLTTNLTGVTLPGATGVVPNGGGTAFPGYTTPTNTSFVLYLFVTGSAHTGFDDGQCIVITTTGVTDTNATAANACEAPATLP